MHRKWLLLAGSVLWGSALAGTPQVTINLLVPVEVRNLPSDIDNLTVRCIISAPARHWEASTPVHLGAGRFSGTVTVRIPLPQDLPYDATYGCSLQLSNSLVDVLESVRRVHPDPAFPKVIVTNGSFH